MTQTVRVSALVNIPAGNLAIQGTAYCPAGYTVTGGGATMGNTNDGTLASTEPFPNVQAWNAWGRSSSATTMTVYAICMRMT
ncbi:hypothetical protein ACFOY4_20695 [Actinomadura syzygii]|uniref:hypothetical protein n=1 Tax=Actinomadura syzygii TaxID=1427538 RepID=UPI001CA37CCC|nr:hypothetical protein [Actinomadura syzygii]